MTTPVLSLFGMAFLLGLIFNAAPGAVFAETIRRGVDGGYQPALAVQIGSLAGDAAWAILGLAGIRYRLAAAGGDAADPGGNWRRGLSCMACL